MKKQKMLIDSLKDESLNFPYNYGLTRVIKDDSFMSVAHKKDGVKIDAVQNNKCRVSPFYKSISRMEL